MNRLEIAGYGYTNASQLLGDANRFTAVAVDGLADTLAGGAGMAGDSSIADDFAAAYDEGAAGLVAALDDVVDAFANLCRLAYCSFENHYRAEASSIASTVVFSTEPSALSTSLYAGASPVPPSVLGGDASSAPGWANVILDHVEGFVWPDADVDRLRSTADAWRRTADQLGFVVGLGGRAILELFEERSPEIPLATQAIGEVRCGLREIVDGCHQLARACEDYAEAVETQREAILDLVRDLIRDAVLIQAAGFVLGLVTAGSGNAVAAWVNSGKLAAELPRFKAILGAIRAAGAAVAGPVRAGSASVVRVRNSLSRFKNAAPIRAWGHSAVVDAGALTRVRSVLGDPRRFDPQLLRGMSRRDVRELLEGWTMRPAKDGVGLAFEDPANRGRIIRVMRGYYRGNRPDPLTHGDYIAVSQNGHVTKVALEGNPTL